MPDYLIYGISPDEFWNGDPWLAWAYRQAYEANQKYKNADSWWDGVYIKEAVRSALSETLPWFKRQTIDYPREPHRITPLTEEEKKQQSERERQKAVNSFNLLKEAWDRKHG